MPAVDLNGIKACRNDTLGSLAEFFDHFVYLGTGTGPLSLLGTALEETHGIPVRSGYAPEPA